MKKQKRSKGWRDLTLPHHRTLERANGPDWQRWQLDLEGCAATATKPVTAYALAMMSLYDSWFIAYGYHYRGRQYVFAWETPYDELHRGFAGGPAAWYDGLGQGQPIRIAVDPDDPKRHAIRDERFAAIKRVAVLDPGC